MGKTDFYSGGSDMTEAHYLKKYEKTCIYEDPDQTEKYHRSLLVDARPDAPLFEDEEPRYNNYSSDKLNLRHHGRRVATEPYLEDGTFLEFDGLQPDSRGAAFEPDMTKHRKQQEVRGKFVKYSKDDDFSVPSSGRNQARVISDNKRQFYDTKKRLKIFDASRGNFIIGYNGHDIRNPNTKCMQVSDERSREMQDEKCSTRKSRFNDLNIDTSVTWKRSTDHVFQVAKYGMSKKSQAPSTQDFLKNRANSRIGHDIMVSWNGQNVSKSVSLKMIDMAKQKYRDMKSANNVLFASSDVYKTRKYGNRISPEDIIARRGNTASSHEQTANASLNGHQSQHIVGTMLKPRLDSNRFTKAIIDPDIIMHMSSVNRKLNTEQTDDLREQILQSTNIFDNLLIDQVNSKCAQIEKNNELLWDSIANHEKGVSMKVANYGRIAENIAVNGPKNHNAIDCEEYKESQQTSAQRNGGLKPSDMYNMESAEYEQSQYEPIKEVTSAKLNGALGSKYMRGHLEKENIGTGINSEVTARCSR